MRVDRIGNSSLSLLCFYDYGKTSISDGSGTSNRVFRFLQKNGFKASWTRFFFILLPTFWHIWWFIKVSQHLQHILLNLAKNKKIALFNSPYKPISARHFQNLQLIPKPKTEVTGTRSWIPDPSLTPICNFSVCFFHRSLSICYPYFYLCGWKTSQVKPLFYWLGFASSRYLSLCRL